MTDTSTVPPNVAPFVVHVTTSPDGMVAPAPLPLSFQVGRADPAGQTIALRLFTPAGVQVLFMPREFALQLRDALTHEASGLTIAPG